MPANRAPGLQVIDPFLSTIARRYKSQGFIADQLLPSIKVAKDAGQFPVFGRDYWFAQQTDNKGSDRAPSREVDYEWSTDTYRCEEYKLKISLTDHEVEQAESELRLRQTKTEYLTHQMNLAREVRVAALLDTVDNGGGLDSSMDTTPGTNWDQATAAIESDVKGGKLAVYDEIGYEPNTIVIPFKVAYAMAIQEDIREQISYSIQGGNGQNVIELGDRLLPSTFHGMRVVIPRGQKSSAKTGSSGTLSEIWGDEVRLLYVNASAAWGEPSVAYSLEQTPRTVTRWREIDPDREMVRELERVDEKIVAPFAGYVLRDVLS